MLASFVREPGYFPSSHVLKQVRVHLTDTCRTLSMGGRWVGEFRVGGQTPCTTVRRATLRGATIIGSPHTFGDVDVSGGEIPLERRH